jgi:hypothetical protein
MVCGKRCDIGLGGLKLISLAEAREQARKYRQMARNDVDPVAEKRRARQVVPTFKQAAEAVHKEHAKAWKNAKHCDQWINTLNTYVFPVFGDRKVDQVQTPDILKALTPIWLTKPETAPPSPPAHRHRTRLGQSGGLPVGRQPCRRDQQGAAAATGPQGSFCGPTLYRGASLFAKAPRERTDGGEPRS